MADDQPGQQVSKNIADKHKAGRTCSADSVDRHQKSTEKPCARVSEL